MWTLPLIGQYLNYFLPCIQYSTKIQKKILHRITNVRYDTTVTIHALYEKIGLTLSKAGGRNACLLRPMSVSFYHYWHLITEDLKINM